MNWPSSWREKAYTPPPTRAERAETNLDNAAKALGAGSPDRAQAHALIAIGHLLTLIYEAREQAIRNEA